MTRSTQTLPENYTQSETIRLSKNKGLLILLNIAGLAIMILAFYFLQVLCTTVHPEMRYANQNISSGVMLLIIGLSIFMLIAHEAVHGLFFWFFTHARPVFALKWSYAYAAAPDWFIPVNQYAIVGLAPLIIIDLLCIFIILVAPISWCLLAGIIAALNTGGAVGDLWIILRLLFQPADTLVQDTGNSVSFFSPQSRE